MQQAADGDLGAGLDVGVRTWPQAAVGANPNARLAPKVHDLNGAAYLLQHDLTSDRIDGRHGPLLEDRNHVEVYDPVSVVLQRAIGRGAADGEHRVANRKSSEHDPHMVG